MNEQTISIFGDKILFEILNEIKIFSKYKVKFFENYNKYLEEKNKGIIIFFLNNNNTNLYKNIIEKNFSILTIFDKSISKKKLFAESKENLTAPFFIKDLEKKITLAFAKAEYKKNSLIYLNGYLIDKN